MEKAFPDYEAPVKFEPDWSALKTDIPAGIPTDVQQKMNIEIDENYTSASEKVKSGWEDGGEALQGYLDTLSQYDPEQLEGIKLSNGDYDVEEDLHGAEDAL